MLEIFTTMAWNHLAILMQHLFLRTWKLNLEIYRKFRRWKSFEIRELENSVRGFPFTCLTFLHCVFSNVSSQRKFRRWESFEIHMSALCVRLPFHFEGSQVEVAVANSQEIILHQNLSPPKILNKCTFSTAEVLQIIWFLQRLSDAICQHLFKWANPPSPVQKKNHQCNAGKSTFFVNWKTQLLSWTRPNPESTTMKSVFSDIMTQELLGKLDQSKGRRRAFGMKPARRANIRHISKTTSASNVLSDRVESTMQ